jgi:hypothetical protein
MVNGTRDFRHILMALPVCCLVLGLVAWCRGAEYDEQYTLFLTAGVPRPDWPEDGFPAGLARVLQSGRAGPMTIGWDLRVTDVHPPLYFWLLAPWRAVFGPGLAAARGLSVLMGTVTLGLTGVAAARLGVPPARAMLLTLGCYGFAYTNAIARGFSLAMLLIMAGTVLTLHPGRTWRLTLSGLLLGLATFSNYLALFSAAAVLLAAAIRRGGAATLAAMSGFLLFPIVDLWWFLAQRGSRDGQFPPFHWLSGLTRLANRLAGAILGGLPLYVPYWASTWISLALGTFLLVLAWRMVRGWLGGALVAPLAAAATPLGLLLLGALFDNTPIELRYLAFSLPFLGIMLAGTLGPRIRRALMAVQVLSIAGLIAAPETMQPARAAAVAAAALAGDGVVLLPRGNDGVGIVGAFAIEAPPGLTILPLSAGEDAARITVRLAPWRRVVLVAMAQDDAGRAAITNARTVLTAPPWREVARDGLAAVYERRADGG